jgi:hypothetical protein
MCRVVKSFDHLPTGQYMLFGELTTQRSSILENTGRNQGYDFPAGGTKRGMGNATFTKQLDYEPMETPVFL